MAEFNFSEIEKKWQKIWEKEKIFEVKESKKKKFYVLEMFPYPSASFLHMGHVRNYTIGDVFARFKRMNGFNVLYPMGYDSFGLPAENASKKEGIHPKEYTEKAIKKIIEYQKKLGNSYDWSRVISTHTPEYFKWNQYFFIKFFEKGLVYRKKAPVNWCPKCTTVLADEEVESGKCWRCESEVVTRDLEQWFFKITAYADELLNGLDNIHWSDRLKTMQRNWIGKSEGTEILFDINGKKWSIFTTRPDTIFGITFMVISAHHPRLMELVTKEQKKDVEKFLKKIKSSSKKDLEELEKEGVFTGSYAINPMTKEKVPVYAGNFVVADYGSGMIMAVPAHDQRDFEFAKKYKIKIKIVIQSEDFNLNPIKMSEAYISGGKLINSGDFNDLFNEEAKEHITDFLESKKLGKRVVNYKLRDWLISRQRFWGTPIPIIYCDKCRIVPVPEKDLPVLLPDDVKFSGNTNPILSSKKFQNVKCPKCGGKGRRETDTMGGFMDSSWYFLRYCDPKNNKSAFDKKKVEYWMPVDQYIGGIEHAVGHLMYSRFFTKALRDLGFLNFDEPFTNLLNQGIVYKDGVRMSKSKGNTVSQDEIANKYGIDTARLFLMFVASPEKQMEWNDEGIEGSFRIINRIISLYDKIGKSENNKMDEHKSNLTIKKVTENIETFEYPKVIIAIIEFINYLSSKEKISKNNYQILIKLISPFCPHIAEELWEKIGNKSFVSTEKWPISDESKINEKLEQQEKAVDNLISDINNVLKIVGENKKVFVYTIPKEKEVYENSIGIIKKKTNLEVFIYAVNDKDKYDPENKSKKAKPERPAIYLE